jgi:tripartite-type tricarboxylate transporter receptor subunit TctC
VELPRRQFLHLAVAITVLPAAAARALDYPTRPVRLVVGYAPGFPPDIIARVVGQWLSERLPQAVVVDNRPGAASNIASEIVAKSPPDGYTLLFIVSTNAVNATLYQHPNFDFARDLVPFASIGGTPYVITVNPSFPPKTVPELVAYTKANPGKTNMASGGVGSSPHVSGELFKMMTGASWIHVPYRTNFLPDLLGGQVQLAFPSIGHVIEFIRNGQLRALAVTSPIRSDVLPHIPAVAEFVPGYAATGWYGISAPAGTPADITTKINAEVSAAVADPKLRAQLAGLGIEPRSMTSAEFSKFVTDETEKWAKVIKFAGMKPD